ncbi:MAG: hypothetical protein AAF791_04445 [Bacteroidota bacterium]
MPAESIRIRVTSDAARAYREAPRDQQRKLDALLSLRLREATQEPESLETVMDEIAANAEARGLTDDVLADLLRDNVDENTEA